MIGGIRSGDQSRGLHSDSGGHTDDQSAESPKHHKSRSGPESVSLSRCAGCYNHRKSTMFRRGDDGESSSSAEDSGPEADWESEPESSCSSSSSEQVLVEIPEKQETEEQHSAAEPQSGGQDGDGRAGEISEGQEDKKRTKRVIQRAPLVKSFSLPSSFTRHLSPMSLLPRPPRIVSTLHLQVLQQTHDSDTFYTLCKHLSDSEEGKTEEGERGKGHLLPPKPFQQWQQGLPWQQRSNPTSQQHQYQQQQLSHQRQQPPHQLSHQYQQQQQQLFSPLAAPGQRLPPPPHSLPVLPPPTRHTTLQAPNAHLHVLAPQTCWYCCRMHFPHTYWSH